MALYFNSVHSKGVVQLGPYTFKGGYIRTSDANDKTVGPILVTFYGCARLTAEEEQAKNEEWSKKKNPNSDLSDEEKANIHNELEAKQREAAEEAKRAAEEAAKKVDEANAKAAAEAKAKAEAEAKAAADASKAVTDKK